MICRSFVAVVLAGTVACGGATVGETSQSREPGSRDGAPIADPFNQAPGDSSPDQTPPSAGNSPSPKPLIACCPPDKFKSGSMYLGGASQGGACTRTSDFWCSTNWRIENDASGCPAWRYDVRAPAPGENQYCQASNLCTPGSYVFCRCADGNEGTKMCLDGKTFDACSCE